MERGARMIDEATKSVSIVWYAQDVIDCAEESNEAKLTESEAWHILKELYGHHNCNYGMTWGHIQAAIDDYLEEQREEQ